MKYTKLVEEVNRILTEEWDPIGVFDMCDDKAHAYTEYSSYAKGIAKMLRDGAHPSKIEQYLNMLRTRHIGLPANATNDHEIANRLSELA